MSAAFLLARSSIAESVCNIGERRGPEAPLDTRKEGWTETWGNADVADKSKPPNTACDDTIRVIDDESIASVLATAHPQTEIVIDQYRPAWFEQAVLKMAGIPFIVRNSTYLASEASGPLPVLRDIRPANSPVLVGRYQKSIKGYQNNAILQYLISHRGVNLDGHLEKAADVAISKSFISLISSDLDESLFYLRFKDIDAWESIYRKDHMSATSPSSDGPISRLGGMFQAWCERSVALNKISTDPKFSTIDEAAEKASEGYKAIDSQLSSHSSPFLLGHSRPSLVDAVLFAHLADALCDVHLVVVLASFPKILNYFEGIYSKSFSVDDKDASSTWNAAINHTNPFQRVPMNQGALLPTERLRVPFQKGLQESVVEAASVRQNEKRPKLDPKETTWYKWRMGYLFEPENAEPDPSDTPTRQKLKKEQARNDQVWISVVVGTSLLTLFLLQKPRSE